MRQRGDRGDLLVGQRDVGGREVAGLPRGRTRLRNRHHPARDRPRQHDLARVRVVLGGDGCQQRLRQQVVAPPQRTNQQNRAATDSRMKSLLKANQIIKAANNVKKTKVANLSYFLSVFRFEELISPTSSSKTSSKVTSPAAILPR